MHAIVTIKPPDIPEPADADGVLVTRLRGGDLQALELLMRRHNQRLFRIARSIVRDEQEAMDVVQETYIKAWYELGQFRGAGGFIGWLSRIARNDALMRVRKAKRIEYTIDEPESAPMTIESRDPQPLDELANRQLRGMLEDAIDKLPLGYRSVYVLRGVQQLSTAETAHTLGISEDLVKTRFARARRVLQGTFKAHMERAQLEVFEFAGHRCDALVRGVLARLRS